MEKRLNEKYLLRARPRRITGVSATAGRAGVGTEDALEAAASADEVDA